MRNSTCRQILSRSREADQSLHSSNSLQIVYQRNKKNNKQEHINFFYFTSKRSSERQVAKSHVSKVFLFILDNPISFVAVLPRGPVRDTPHRFVTTGEKPEYPEENSDAW